MSPEKNFYNRLRNNLSGNLVHLQRIESGTGQGIPDVNYCILGAEGWIELKSFTRKNKKGTVRIPKLRDKQCAWLFRRRMCRGRAYLLCEINDDIALIDGLLAPQLLTGNTTITWEQLPRFCIEYLQAPDLDWSRLTRALSTFPPDVSIAGFKPRD